MSPPKAKKRASILKKRLSSFDSPEPTASSTKKLPKKGILFSEKNTVKEFMQCDEKTTIWGNSYEMSIARSEGSSDGSQTLKKLSCDFSCSSVQSSEIDGIDESEKENYINTRASEIHFEDSHKMSTLSSSTSISGSTLENMTVEMNPDEKQRIKMYGFDSLNFTNMQFDSTEKDNMIISPKTSDCPNEKLKFSLSRQENMLIEQAEPNYSVDFSMQLNSNEIEEIRKYRKTIRNVEDMNITLNSSAQNSSHNLRNPKTNAEESKMLPKVFKQPDVPKLMVFGQNQLANVSDINLDSPPMKPANLQNQRQDLDDFMDFLVTETPTKNLCHQMCMAKKRIITPLTSREQPSTKIISSSATRQRVKEPLENTNLSCNILKDIGLDLSTPSDYPLKESQSVMQTSLSLEKQFRNRRTIVSYDDISIDENKTASTSMVRKSLFESDAIKPQNTEVNLKNSATKTGVNQKPMTQDMSNFDEDSERSSDKCQTVFESDISLDDLVYSKSFLSATKLNDVSDTTTELAQKAARLLSNPMASSASNSILYNLDADISLNADSKSPNFMSKKSGTSGRKTVFIEDMSLQEPFVMKTPEVSSSCQISHNPSKHGNTAIDIDISGIELTERAQASFYELSMQEENISTGRPKFFNSSSRRTIHDTNTMMETSTATFSKFAKPQCSKQRETVYNNARMDETNLHEEAKGRSSNKIQLELKSRNRDENTAAIQSLPSESIYNNKKGHNCKIQEDSMVLTNAEIAVNILVEDHQNQTTSHQNFRENRKTLYDEQEMDISSNAFSLLGAKTISETSITGAATDDQSTPPIETTSRNAYDDISAAETVYDSEMQEENLSELLPHVSTFDEGQHHEKSVSRKSSLDFSIPSSNSQSLSRVYTPPIAFQTIEQMVENDSRTEDEGLHLNRTSLLRKSVIASSNTTFLSFCEAPAKQMNNELEGKRFMNITDTDFRSFIDDESNPCLSETEDTHRNQTPSTSNVNTSYQNALHDFINMTIMDSPLNTTVPVTPNLPIRERMKTRNRSPPIDYCAKLDDLVAQLKKNDEVQPRLPIDEYLEKLNVKPVTIKYLPQMKPDYLSKCLEAAHIKAENNRAAEILAKKNNPQYPKIPRKIFLVENLLKCMEEDRMEQQKKGRIIITPVFPLKESFRFLLKNKFETDIDLSKFWTLDLSHAHFNQYKLLHKVMPGFKLNIAVANPQESIDDSKIPIYFKGFLLYKDPNYRQVQIQRIEFLHNEFRLIIGTDNFLPMCSSSEHLFAFLESFHNDVMKAANLVDNFYRIVLTNDTCLERTHDHFRITARVFLQKDVVDVVIAIRDSIGAISINDISIKGTFSFAYKIVPRQNIATETGLMLLEIVLSDAKKFIEDNTRRFEIE